MIRKIFTFLAILLAMLSQNASANIIGLSDVWKYDFDIPVTRVVDAINDSGGFDHRLYFSDVAGTNCLIVVCHGWHDANDRYGITINNSQHYDYTHAIAEAVEWWHSKGILNPSDIEGVVLITCHTGFAPQTAEIPELGVKLVVINDYKGENGVVEQFDPDTHEVIALSVYRKADPRYPMKSRNRGTNIQDRKITQAESDRMMVY